MPSNSPLFNRLFAVALLGALLGVAPVQAFEFNRDDRVVLIGNVLPERMQHDGWLEAHLQVALPSHGLVFRNHGYSGDRLTKRPRNKGFLDEHTYLSHSKATVIFAMFGYNESFDTEPAKFTADLVKWIDMTRGKNYSGKGAPRIVLFSPIAHEDLGSPDLPDGTENNRRLAAITQAIADAAKQKGVPFVDLFTATQAAYESHDKPLTINGIHLNSEGNKVVAQATVKALLGSTPAIDAAKLEKVRRAVLDKNHHWFNRYRATDGNDVWGSRSKLHGNFATLQRELQQLDVMTANRDKLVHALAQGREHKVVDDNLPPAIKVETNFKSPKLKSQGGVPKIGTLEYLSPEESLKQTKFAKGLKGNVFASEQQFPELVNPVQLGVGPRGRLWAAAWKTYPKWEPTKKMDDRLLILEDNDNDGVADVCKTFAFVHNPTGFEFWGGGVIVASAPDILFLKDTDGDDVADVRIRLFHGIDSADTHHTANNFALGPDGYMYYQRGVFHVSNVETPWKTNQQSSTSGMYRFNPRTFDFSFHARNSPNPHGIGFDYWGYHYATDGTSGRAFQVVSNGKGQFSMRGLLKKTVRPVPASGILSSSHFPEEYNGSFLICNAIAFLGIKQYKLTYDTNTGQVNGTEIEDLMVSQDRNFRPTDFEVTPDGAMFVSDWCNPIIGHMQHNIRDPSRDHDHGRIIRITAPGRPFVKPVPIAGQPIPKLLDALKHTDNGIRQRARVELSARDTEQVMAATATWIRQFDPSKKEDAHHLLEALWLHQQFNVENTELLATMLRSPEPHARIAARRVQEMWSIDRTKSIDMSGLKDEEPKPQLTPKKELIARGFKKGDLKQYALGAKVFVREGHCATCHQINGKGLPKLYPPLLDSEWVQGDEDRLIKITLMGLWGELTVKGKTYNGPGMTPTPPMTPFHGLLDDKELAAVLTYVRNTFENKSKPVSAKKVAAIRASLKDRDSIFSVAEILKLHPLKSGQQVASKSPVEPIKWHAWTLKELEGDVRRMKAGRSFALGKAAFDKLGCAQCHKLGKEGGMLGPNLADTFKKYRNRRHTVLEQILEPAKIVEDKFKGWSIDTLDGEQHIGMIVSEGKDHVMLVTNPQNPVPQKIMKKEILSRKRSNQSLMPQGLLNTLTKTEILDLMAYLESVGNPRHKLFKGK